MVEPLRVSVAADGTLAAIHEAPRVRLLEVPSGVEIAEIGVDPDALASEVAWVGTPPRLLVLARHAAHSTVHLLDPYGPRTLAEIQLPSPMRLVAAVGSAALVVGAQSAAVLTASESYLMPYQFPARIMPVAAGAAAGQFVVALAGSIEEWDPQSRMPKRRLRLPRAAAITAIGGSERLVWVTTREEPARIEVISFVNRGQPKAHDLPEPIARVAGHPRSELVACIGADTGRLYIVDLDGRAQLRVIEPNGIDRVEAAALIVGRMLGVLAVKARHPAAIVPLDSRDFSSASGAGIVLPSSDPAIRLPLFEPPDETARRSTLTGGPSERGGERAPDEPDEPADRGPEPAAARFSIRLESPRLASPSSPPPAASTPAPAPAPPLRPSRSSASSPAISVPPVTRGAPPASARPAALAPAVTSSARPPAAPAAPPAPASSPSSGAGASTSKRMSAWRDLVRQTRQRVDPVEPAAPAAPIAPVLIAPAAPTVPAAPVAPVTPAAPIAPAPDPAGPPPRSDARRSWRDEVVAWSRAVSAGTVDEDGPTAPPIDAVIARLDLARQLRPVLVMLYGAHLCGELGVAPVDIARVLARSWDEALGRGQLARRGVAEYSGSRVALSPRLLRVLDELPPVTGTLVGAPGPVALPGPYVVIAGDEPLPAIAVQCLARVGGAILAAHDGVDPAELSLEARAYGAVPMLRLAARLEPAPSDPAIFVVSDAELAEHVGLPRLAQRSFAR
jgi:hypothetical protein